MAKAALNIRAIDASGNAISQPWCEVIRELGGLPVQLYSDRAGVTPIGNPFQLDTNGKATVYPVSGGAFKVRIYTGPSGDPTFEDIQRHVAIGLAAETDAVSFVPVGAWDAGTTHGIGNVVSHADGGDTYLFASLQASNLNNEPDASSPADTAYWMLLPGLQGATGPGGSSDVTGTSTTSLSTGTGEKVFTIVEDDRGWDTGARLRASSDADPADDYMEGVVTGYSGNTLTLEVDYVGPAAGSGPFTDWTINLAGAVGAAGGGFADVVDDTSPQLGGMLDVNGNAIGDGTRELLTFTEDGSAVNHVNVENQATGGGPIISAAGDDTNIDLILAGKGSGVPKIGSDAILDAGDIGVTIQAYDAQLFSNIPQNSKSDAYTLGLTDGQKHIFHPSADTTARIWTIPANASVAFPIGTAITFVNQNGAGAITIAITSDTMRLAGAGTTGSRTLAANGVATAIKVTSTEWIISGTGLT